MAVIEKVRVFTKRQTPVFGLGKTPHLSFTKFKLFIAHSNRLFTPQALFGTSLTMADGVFTPAVSVTSAVGGIAVATESVSSDIVPISIVSSCSRYRAHALNLTMTQAFIVVLFLVQRFGTSKLAWTFAPSE